MTIEILGANERFAPPGGAFVADHDQGFERASLPLLCHRRPPVVG